MDFSVVNIENYKNYTDAWADAYNGKFSENGVVVSVDKLFTKIGDGLVGCSILVVQLLNSFVYVCRPVFSFNIDLPFSKSFLDIVDYWNES